MIQALIKTFLQGLRDKSIGLISKKYDMSFEDFSDYLRVTYNKCSNVKTIITREKPYELSDIYVNARFRCGDEVYDDFSVCQEARDNRRIVVTGFGGIGKTIFAKHLWLSIFKEPSGRIPVFFELRKMNNLTTIDMETIVRNTLFPAKRTSRENLFDEFLYGGRFIFIFDAFDELNEDKKGIVEEQILSIAHRYPDCGIVVTSRREHRFDTWEQFHIFKALPFEKEQVKDLIQRIDFESDVKKKFIQQIVENGFEEHKSFLSTPLLSLMMLMTFSQYGELPEKIHIFYRYAFQALYAWHDASKEAFRRERQSGLLIDQFEKVFSIFCLVSYYDFETIFSDDEIRGYVEKARKHVEFEFVTENFILEAEQAVNLIFRDGNWYSFTHRSFQEYFTAFSLSNYFPNRLYDILENMAVRPDDNMLSMLNEINPVITEENFLSIAYGKYKEDLVFLTGIRNSIEFLSTIEFRIFAMVTWHAGRRRVGGKVREGAPTPHFTIHFGDYGGVRKIAEIVCIMFRSRYESEVGDLNYSFAHRWLGKSEEFLRKVVSEVAGGNFDHRNERMLNVTVSFSTKRLVIHDRDGIVIHEQAFEFEEIVGDTEALEETFKYLKRQLVFSKKILESVNKTLSMKRVSIDDLLRR